MIQTVLCNPVKSHIARNCPSRMSLNNQTAGEDRSACCGGVLRYTKCILCRSVAQGIYAPCIRTNEYFISMNTLISSLIPAIFGYLLFLSLVLHHRHGCLHENSLFTSSVLYCPSNLLHPNYFPSIILMTSNLTVSSMMEVMLSPSSFSVSLFITNFASKSIISLILLSKEKLKAPFWEEEEPELVLTHIMPMKCGLIVRNSDRELDIWKGEECQIRTRYHKDSAQRSV